MKKSFAASLCLPLLFALMLPARAETVTAASLGTVPRTVESVLKLLYRGVSTLA